MTKTHNAWLIDLDGTLYRSFPVKLAMAAELCLAGPTAWKTISTFRKQHELIRHQEAKLDGDPFSKQLELTAQSLKQSVEETRAIVKRWMIERPGKWLRLFRRSSLLQRIEEYRAAGGRTALVSDYPAAQKLAAMNADGLFDVVIASGEAEQLCSLKPNPSGYLLAAERLEVPAIECLVIGDREDADGQAAKNAGMSFELVG
jgi:putative hydrolase of the HAD superfamily